jgi:hypothetical protein
LVTERCRVPTPGVFLDSLPAIAPKYSYPGLSPRKSGLSVRLGKKPHFLIPRTEHHRRRLLHEWVQYYNAGRPHMALGPGTPQPSPYLPVPLQAQGHRLPEHLRVDARPVLAGLPHEYRLEKGCMTWFLRTTRALARDGHKSALKLPSMLPSPSLRRHPCPRRSPSADQPPRGRGCPLRSLSTSAPA